ncbi:MAG: response regulator [Candidatus Anstonellales archaeon]
MLNILVVEDNETLLKLYIEAFRVASHSIGSEIQITTAENGRVGLKRFLERWNDGHPFDAVFTDEDMPEMTGREMSAEIRKLCGIPIIRISGSLQKEEGYFTFNLQKPFKLSNLIDIVRNIRDSLELSQLPKSESRKAFAKPTKTIPLTNEISKNKRRIQTAQ